MVLNKEDDFLCDCVDEAIAYITDGVHTELELIIELIDAMRSNDSERIKECLQKIQTERYRIFDDGLYHLPGKPLQDLTQQVLDIAEEMCEEKEE